MNEKKSISELTDVIRSKNAGPYELTLDLIFKSFSIYEEIKEREIINKDMIADLYNIDSKNILSVINYDPAKAIKVTLIRPCSAGAVGETDVYGAQQHAPLLDIEVDIEI